MKILIIDTERAAIMKLTDAISELLPGSELIPFISYEEFSEYKQKSGFDAAFIGLIQGERSGVELALELKESSPLCNIIFISERAEIPANCFRARPSGLITKPFTAGDIKTELEDLRHPTENDKLFDRRLRVITFGSFIVYKDDGTLLTFRRSASKEIFAYLIDQCGYPVSSRDIAQDVFEDSEFRRQTSKNISKYITYLVQDLTKAGYADAVIRQNRTIQINRNRLNCDLYKAFDGDVEALNTYKGEYMIDYSWSETSESAMRLRRIFD